MKKVILPKQARSLLAIVSRGCLFSGGRCQLCRRRSAPTSRITFLEYSRRHLADHYAAAEEQLLALGSLIAITNSPNVHVAMSSLVEQVFGFRPATSQATEFWQQHPADLSNGPLWEGKCSG